MLESDFSDAGTDLYQSITSSATLPADLQRRLRPRRRIGRASDRLPPAAADHHRVQLGAPRDPKCTR